MEIKPGLSALVTGGASGIGTALALALGEKGIFVTVVDLSEEKGKEIVSLIQKANAKFYPDLEFPSATYIRCDVTNTRDLAAAFEKHLATYGGLDICINSAGIVTSIPFYTDQTDGTHSWRHALNVNLAAVIDCTHRAVYAPPFFFFLPASVPFLKAESAKLGVEPRVSPSCSLVKAIQAAQKPGVIINLGSSSGLYPMYYDPIYSGSKGCVVMFTRSLVPYKRQGIRVNVLCPEFVETEMGSKVDPKLIDMMGGFIPMEMVIKVLTPLPLPLDPHQVLVKVIYAGVNASDVNFTSGCYFNGKDKDLSSSLPLDAGFEAVGIIAAVGQSVHHLKVGTPAALMTFGSYAEFTVVSAKHILPVPRSDPEIVAMLTSGLTASIALEKAGMDSGKVVLVTAAAGGTGQFAVQLAKLAGNKVVGTCGGNEKAMLLKELGVHLVIDYKAEDIKTVLEKEFPKGIDIVYESVGGEIFDLCVNALAVHGRLIVIGMISQYQGEHGWRTASYCEKILAKSQTVVFIDPKRFVGVDAVEYLHSGKSVGKVVVCMDPTFSEQMAKL